MEEFNKKIKEYARKIGIELTEKQIQQFYTYMELLLQWNQKINLTAITEPEEVILKHFIDSLTIAKWVEKDTKLVDVGTGAGFPGIPLKIVRSDIEITLLDSLNKRINFLNEVIQKLELTKIHTVHARVEEFARNKAYREKFDYATSRAVANLSTLAEYLLPLVKIKGKSLCMKGSHIEEELEQSKNAIFTLGGKLEKVDYFQLPGSNIERAIVMLYKEKQTPQKYPRKPGTPAKEPIR